MSAYDRGTGFEVFYEPRQEECEMDLLCDFSGTFYDSGIAFQYKEVGNIYVFKTDAEVILTEDEREVIDAWFADRADLLFHEVGPLSRASLPLKVTVYGDDMQRRVLLLITPSIH